MYLSKNMITEYEFYVNDESGNLMNETIRADVIIMSQETYLLSVTTASLILIQSR